jgi:4'-phosphopantetheinyl transferase
MWQYLIYDDMTRCTEADMERMKSLASKQRVEQAMRYKHCFGQWACLKSYELLCQLLQTDIPFDFCYNEYGKPYFTSVVAQQFAMPFFSISHCKDAIAVVVSDREVGIDVESRHRHTTDSLVESVMNENEQEYIASRPEQDTAFIELWTKKEAVLKQRGTGITDHLKNVLTGNEHIETLLFDNYIVSICI